jgi:pimeloyl-ACP methyl ester carboxylesterase
MRPGGTAVPFARGDNAGPVEIWYEEQGAGAPVVAVGGLTSTIETWGLQAPALAARFRLVLFDHRGSGRTRVCADDGVRTPARMAGDVRVLLDALGLERVHLIGASMGGMVVQAFALAWPERLRSLVIACSSCGGPHATPAAPEVVHAMLRGAAQDASEAERRAALAVLVHPESPARRAEGLAFYEATKKAWPHPAEEVARRALGIRGFDAWADLPRIRVPTLVVTGSDDALVPPANSRLLAERIPGAELVVVPDAGHVFFCEQAEATNRALVDFLTRVEAVEATARPS